MKQEILKKVKEQLAKDYNCSVEDFDNRNNLITNIKLNEGARRYTDDKEILKELSHCKEQASSFIADAALAIVVMADPLASDVWIEDASIASIMIQLQAEDLGLGSCWVQVRERFTATGMPSDEFVHGILDIPLQLQILSVIAIGHKGMERKPFNEEHLQWEKIHINKFGGK